MSDPRPSIGYLEGRDHAPTALERLGALLAAQPWFPPLARLARRLGLTRRWVVIAIPYTWLVLFFLVPFLIVLKISFAESILAQPPYTALFAWVEEAGRRVLTVQLNLDNYRLLLEDDLYWRSYLNSVRIAATATLLTLIIGLPMAYAMARAPQAWRMPLVMLVILPFWTSLLIRVYAWIGILRSEGYLNSLLLWLGVIDQPLVILNTELAIYIGLTYSYLPFMILPIYASLERLDWTLLEAAADLGCRPARAFWAITVPLARPGIIAGCFLVFIPAVGEFVVPDLLGGAATPMIGKVLWSEFFQNRDWPLSSAVAVVLLLILVAPIALWQRGQTRGGRAA